jgi:hypothetical protein
MSGTHPIDELFRRSLQGASADPPPEVGLGVLAQVRAKRRRALIWRRGLLVSLLLLIGSTASVIWVMQSGEGANANSAIATKNAGPAPVDAVLPATSTGVQELVEQPRSEGSSPRLLREAAAPASLRAADEASRARKRELLRTPRPLAFEPSVVSESSDGGSDGAVTDPPTPQSHIEGGFSANALDQAPSGRVHDEINRLRPMNLISNPLPKEPWRAHTPDAARPRGSWWTSITLSAQASRYQWRSDQANLQRALQGNGRWQGGMAIGVLAGRAWPSGLSIGVGVEADRLDQTYRNLDQRTERQTETVTQVITLNTQVFASSVDTISTEVVREAQAEGADRRLRIRIPLEAAWQLAAKRWRFGPRVGLVGEHTSIRSSASLAVDPSDQLVRARQLSQAELRMRYPFSLSAIAGIDLGFVLTDRSRIIATPFASRALTTFGDPSDANARPERFGLRLMIQHCF